MNPELHLRSIPARVKLYILRHANADWPDWKRPDAERPLTAKGRKQARRVGKFLADRKIVPAVILSSPLPRARQTAEGVAKKLKKSVALAPALAPGFHDRQLQPLLKAHRRRDVMLVGHEPDLSRIVRSLTGARVELSKAGLACIDLPAGANAGTLCWLLTPKICRS